MKDGFISIFILTAWLSFQAGAATLNWDMDALWGISESGFDSAIAAANNHFKKSPNDTIIIHIAAGTHEITGADGVSINLRSGYLLDPADQGRLIFQGAGMDETVLVFIDTDTTQIDGRNLAHVTFRDIHMTRAQYTVSQGTVVAVETNYVDLAIHDGFPMPNEIIRWSDPQGLYLRRYTPSKTDPLIITDENNQQVRWATNSYAVATNSEGIVTWRMIRESAGELTSYQPGEYVGIKSKHTGNTYFFIGSNDIVFENIKWTHSTRGVLRGGTSNVRFSGCRIERSPAINGQTPCLSGPGGGPQMNQPLDDVSTNMVVENCYIESTGDDCVAFFHVDGGVVSNCVFRDSFARGILLTEESGHVVFKETIVSRGPIQQDSPPTDTVAPAPPTGFSLVDGSGSCLLSWNPNAELDLHYYQIYRKLDGQWWEYAMTTDLFYDDLWAQNGVIHDYYIKAVDTSGNHSAASPVITEPPDYDLWAAGYALTGSNALVSADIEPDGVNNYLEYALGGNPTNPDAAAVLPVLSISSSPDSNSVEYIYRRRHDYVSRGIRYTVEYSTNLISHAWMADGVIESGSEAFDEAFDLVTNHVPPEGASQKYMRLRVEQ